MQTPIPATVTLAERTGDHASVVPLMLAALIAPAGSRPVCSALARGFVAALAERGRSEPPAGTA